MSLDESNLQWCDGHLDLAYLAVNGRDVRSAEFDPGVGCVTLPALRQGEVRWMFATIFTEMGLDGEDQAHRYANHDDREGAHLAGMRQIECYERLQRAGEMSIIRGKADVDRGVSPRALILMEGADPIRSPDEVGGWHARGVRMVGLSWAYGSRYAGGNSDGGPLTALGRDMVDALDAHGVMHDVSHLSDAAFDAVLSRAKGRVVASHSNCRALLEPKQRHLRDDQIRAIVERGGVIGLNLYGKFLATGRRATVEDCLNHVEHVANVAGRRDVVALGSDMDGGFAPNDLPEDVDHPTKLGALADGLRGRGWSESETEGFASVNWLRVLRAALP